VYFERWTVHRVVELVVMPGHDDRAREVARRRGVPESVRPKIRTVRDHPRGPHALWQWAWDVVEHLPIKEGGE
jgi:hypothetical protein